MNYFVTIDNLCYCLWWHFRTIDILMTCFTVCSPTCFVHLAVQAVSISRKHFVLAKYHSKLNASMIAICRYANRLGNITIVYLTSHLIIFVTFEILTLPVTVTGQSYLMHLWRVLRWLEYWSHIYELSHKIS